MESLYDPVRPGLDAGLPVRLRKAADKCRPFQSTADFVLIADLDRAADLLEAHFAAEADKLEDHA